MQKVLVTGGGGYIGKRVVGALEKADFEVYVADPNYKPQHKNIHAVNASIFNGNKDIFEELGSPDVLIHLAWRDGFNHGSDSHIEDLPKHYRFLSDMLEGGLKHVVGMGTMHEVGYHEGAITEDTPTNPQSLYGIAKNSLRQLTEGLAEKNGAVFQWIRGYYITGSDSESRSVFSKIIEADKRGDKHFPFVSGEKKFDFIDIDELGHQITAVASQRTIVGIVNCCSGTPVKLTDRAQKFLEENGLNIELQYGAFPDRPYDSPAVWGDDTKIKKIMASL